MKRRNFICLSAAGVAGLPLVSVNRHFTEQEMPYIRLGGPVFGKYDNPGEWTNLLKSSGYRAAYCPVGTDADDLLIRSYREAAEKKDIIIAEVGAWGNPLSPDEAVARQAMTKCMESLLLAEKIGARCCVNISGSRNPEQWAGPHPDNLTSAVFDLIVETTRKIIDTIQPVRTFFTLETMPWAYPDSADSYLRLIRAIDRKQFAVHLDPVNMVTSPQVLYGNGDMIRDAFSKLGRYIKSCHAKDVVIKDDTALPHLDEIRPGLGLLDYRVLLAELSKWPDVPLMIEHLPTAEEYLKAADYIRKTGQDLGIRL